MPAKQNIASKVQETEKRTKTKRDQFSNKTCRRNSSQICPILQTNVFKTVILARIYRRTNWQSRTNQTAKISDKQQQKVEKS